MNNNANSFFCLGNIMFADYELLNNILLILNQDMPNLPVGILGFFGGTKAVGNETYLDPHFDQFISSSSTNTDDFFLSVGCFDKKSYFIRGDAFTLWGKGIDIEQLKDKNKMNYSQHVNPRQDAIQIAQSEPIPGKDMVLNNDGGYVFGLDKWKCLERFLILGTEGGTYYVSEKKLTKDNAKIVENCINEDGLRVVNKIIEISDQGRAPKNDPALFALAMCASLGNPETKKLALKSLPKVARIGTHLFHFAEYVQAFRGWGRMLKKSIQKWYNNKTIDELIHQVTKYKQRDGWSHRDLLVLAHPKADNETRNLIYKWIVHPETDVSSIENLNAAVQLSKETSEVAANILITKYNLPRECVNTALLNSMIIWQALLKKMPLTALIRNLGKMTSIDLLRPLSLTEQFVIEKLQDPAYIRKSRVHPLSILMALMVYSKGHGEKGNLSWVPNTLIQDRLQFAFYSAFSNVVPTNKRLLLGLDVSSSMESGKISGMGGITPAIASAALALITAATEKNRYIMGFSNQFIDLGISPTMRLQEVDHKIQGINFGLTDCSLPMLYALEHGMEVDAFIVYTDNETNCGKIHPSQALQQYRQKTGIDAKLIVVGMQANDFTIADPNDSGMLDIVGFDTTTPAVISDFIMN